MQKKSAVTYVALGCVLCAVAFSAITRRERFDPIIGGLPQPGQRTVIGHLSETDMPVGVAFTAGDQGHFRLFVEPVKGADVSENDVRTFAEYFLAALAVPVADQWVNLSPSESTRVLAPSLADTALGTTLLRQDYVLKQVAATLTDPKTPLGKAYWAQGRGDLAKIWIEPGEIRVADDGERVVVECATLRVRSESAGNDLLIPALTDAVNRDALFAPLRQAYRAMILASRCKAVVRSGAVMRSADGRQTAGLRNRSGSVTVLFGLYAKAYTRGAYHETTAQGKTHRQYFCGGFDPNRLTTMQVTQGSSAVDAALPDDVREATIEVTALAAALYQAGLASSDELLAASFKVVDPNFDHARPSVRLDLSDARDPLGDLGDAFAPLPLDGAMYAVWTFPPSQKQMKRVYAETFASLKKLGLDVTLAMPKPQNVNPQQDIVLKIVRHSATERLDARSVAVPVQKLQLANEGIFAAQPEEFPYVIYPHDRGPLMAYSSSAARIVAKDVSLSQSSDVGGVDMRALGGGTKGTESFSEKSSAVSEYGFTVSGADVVPAKRHRRKPL